MAEIHASARAEVSLKLDPSEYFDVEYDGTRIRVERLNVSVREGSLGGNGSGTAYKKDGTLGTATRSLYTVPKLPAALRNQVVLAASEKANALAEHLNG
jgi:hypothetical protein